MLCCVVLCCVVLCCVVLCCVGVGWVVLGWVVLGWVGVGWGGLGWAGGVGLGLRAGILLYVKLTFVVEAVHLVDGSRLVVPPHDEKVLWVLDLVTHEEADRFKAAFSAVHVVPGTKQKKKARKCECQVRIQPQKHVVDHAIVRLPPGNNGHAIQIVLNDLGHQVGIGDLSDL